MLTVGSLFAGIGGFDLGLERAGMRSVWQSELDPYCQRVLAKHWPDVLRVPDVRDVGPATVPYVDVICGGFPCQDISLAGLGAGLSGARSGLWVEYARIVRELRPRYVVVENVSALLARGLGTVVGDLAAIGYDAEWDCIPASAVGAPHRRDRIWLVAYPNGSGGEARGGDGVGACTVADDRQPARQGGPVAVADADEQRRYRGAGQLGPGRRAEPSDSSRGVVQDTEGQRRAAQRPRGVIEAGPDRDPAPAGGHWAVEPDVGRVAHGVPQRVDRLRALGNALVPQIAEWIGRRIIDYEQGELRDAA